MSAVLLVTVACRQPTAPNGIYRLSGPATIAPGGTVAYQLFFYDSGTNTADVSSAATWTSRRPDIVEMQSDGVAVARMAGETTIDAAIGRTAYSKSVLVLEPGTFKLSGQVIDSKTNAGVGGAIVEVITGDVTGLSTTTNPDNGTFILYGVSSNSTLQVTASGFTPQAVGAEPYSSNQIIPLFRTGTRDFFSGPWLLTFTSPSCTDVPEFVRTRQFTADVLRIASDRFTVNISGPTVRFASTLFGRPISSEFEVEFPGGSSEGGEHFYSFGEKPDATSWLWIRGTVRATVADSVATGRLYGALDYSARNARMVSCTAVDVTITLE